MFTSLLELEAFTPHNPPPAFGLNARPKPPDVVVVDRFSVSGRCCAPACKVDKVGLSEFEEPGLVCAGDPRSRSCISSNDVVPVAFLLHSPPEEPEVVVPGLPVLARYDEAGVGVSELLRMLPSELFMLRRASLLKSPFSAAPMARPDGFVLRCLYSGI
jgi:hypothetical protein